MIDLLPIVIALTLSVLITSRLTRSKRWRLYRLRSGRTFGLGWLAVLLISIAIQVIGYVLMPKPKAPKPEAAKELDDPVAEAGKPVSVVVGTMQCTELNILWSGDKSIRTYNVDL